MSNNRPSILNDNVKCSCKGFNLDKLLQPNILTLIAEKGLHGYVIIQELEKKNLFQGEKVDNTGIYRALKSLEEKGLVSSEWDVKDGGAAKKIYTINGSGKECLANWIRTLEEYKKTIDIIIQDAKTAVKTD